jgi:hypothetical protein
MPSSVEAWPSARISPIFFDLGLFNSSLLFRVLELERMFNAIQMMAAPTEANLATQALSEERTYRFHAFSADDAITLVRG